MQTSFIFWWKCISHAARGTVAFANDWAWLFGVPATVIIVQILFSSGGGQSITGHAWIDALLAGGIAFAVTWFVIFFVRLLDAPARLYAQLIQSNPGSSSIPYNEWKNLDPIDLNTAAAIWSGTRAEDNVVRHLRFRTLKQAIREGRLKAHNVVGLKPNKNTTVKAADLATFLRSYGALPTEPTLASIAVENTWLPVLNLFDLAEKEYGWNFTDTTSVEILDFVYALRQAGLHKTVILWGKKNHGQQYESITQNEPTRVIDKSHWAQYELDFFKARCDRNNFYVWTQNLRQKGSAADGGFADVQVTRDTAIKWLRDVANKFKGHHQRIHAEPVEKRISLFDAARRAYSETEESTYAEMGRRMGGERYGPANPEEILLWYADGIKDQCSTLTGCRRPSDVPRLHDLTEFKIEMENGDMIAREIIGTTVIDRLTISEHDLLWFIQYAQGFAEKKGEERDKHQH